MKKIFIQFWQWISRHRKKLFYWVLALFVFQICFFDIWWIWISSHVFAANAWGTSSQYLLEKVANWLEEFKFFNVVVNVIIYPILIIAWKLVDNSLVYWEIFWFDAVLRKLRVMMRNIANYWLWFLFIYKICEYLIKWQKTADIKKLLISVLIAWVGIQASWFIMSVLIDASTIVTYGVWWLPVSILEEKEKKDNLKNPYILKTLVSYDAKEPDKLKLFMSTWDIYIAECETFNYGSDPQETLILAPRYIYYEESGAYFSTVKNKCNYDGQVYFFKNLYKETETRIDCKWTGCINEQATYEGRLASNKDALISWGVDDMRKLIEPSMWQILQIWNAHATWWINGNIFKWISYASWEHFWLDIDNEWNGAIPELGLKRLNDVIDSTYAWVFSELYSSLLHIGKNVKITRAEANDGKYTELLNEALALLYAITIAIPLLAMTIVLIWRIWVLWMAIPLSPIIALLKAFDLESKIKSEFLEKFKIENLLPIIFFPAIICFAISLSAVLIKVIISLNWDVVESKELPILSWVIKLDIASFWVAIWRTICAIMCIAVAWFLAWAAIKTTKLWKSKIVTWLADITRSAIWSLPIVPIPTKNWISAVGIDAAFWLNGSQWIVSKLNEEVKGTFRTKENEAVEQMLNKGSTGKQESLQIKTYVGKLKENPSENRTDESITISNWTSQKEFTFKDMNASQQKQVIEEINNLENWVKDNLWKKGEIITKDNKKYIYDTTKHKFVESSDTSSTSDASTEGGQK